MEIEVIERLIALFERSRVNELDYAEGDARLKLARRADAAPAAPTRPAESTAPGTAGAAAAVPVTAAAVPTAHIVAAGMFGTFFRSPAPGQPPFVAPGDMVQEGQTLALLEAMKMLNPVEADRAGRVDRILAEDGAPVEAGAPLFAIVPVD